MPVTDEKVIESTHSKSTVENAAKKQTVPRGQLKESGEMYSQQSDTTFVSVDEGEPSSAGS